MSRYLTFFLIIFHLLTLTTCQSTPPQPTNIVAVPATPTITTTPTSQPPISQSPNLPIPTSTPSPLPTVTPSPPPPPTSTPNPQSPLSNLPTSPLPLSAYPRPPADNGMGIHWSTHLYAQSDEATIYFAAELQAMNIKWVKVLVDGLTNLDHDKTIEALVEREIMPIIRIYQRCNEPYNLDELDALVRYYVEKGVYYYDLYNEPNQPGESGGWCQPGGEPQPEYLAEVWAEAARTIYLAGGYPGLPSFFAPDQKKPDWQNAFFYRFFNALREQGNEETLYYSWASIHNYFINHPPTYPYDEVNQRSPPLTEAEIERYDLSEDDIFTINLNRALARILKVRPLTAADGEPWGLSAAEIEEINERYQSGAMMGYNLYDDSTGFFHFIAYRNQFHDLFGFDIPMISTEGGATRGSGEDPRYPAVDGQTVADWTLWSADYMLDDAPDYYFTTMTWLLAQSALDYEEPIWEGNAWYHDRAGDQEPVVAAMKNRPRRVEARAFCFEDESNSPPDPPEGGEVRQIPSRGGVGGPGEGCLQKTAEPQPGKNPLAAYPRPPADNGRGIHWAPTNQPQPNDVVDYFIDEIKAMNIKWVKFLQDDVPTVTHVYLIEQLIANDIEPVMRVYKPFNEPYEHLPALVSEAKRRGVTYFELYNEPNVAGPAGGWQEGEPISVERIVDLWLAAAWDVHTAGGAPGLPPLAGGGTVDDMLFLSQFLQGIKQRQQEDLLPGAWIPVHNYFLNHPLDYPTDPVNVDDVPLTEAEIDARGLTPEQVEAINEARRIAKLPREEGGFWVGNTIEADSNAFRKFDAYAAIFFEAFGYYLPLISTEGGAILGAAEDPRYPPVQEPDLTRLTLDAYHFMLDEAPAYFFAHTPWLLANNAGGHPDERFENAAWYKDRAGRALPVVEVLKADPRKAEIRNWSEPVIE